MNGWTIGGILVGVALAALTPVVWRRRGPRWGLRWIALALVPVGLGLAGLLKLANEVARFVSRFVFSPTAWVGWTVLGLAVLLWVVARFVGREREPASAPARSGKAEVSGSSRQVEPARPAPAPAPAPRAGASPAADDEFGDIEEILRRRGIS